MPARLTLYLTDRPARECLLESSREYLIGRGEDCDLRIADRRLSRHHARFGCSLDGWRIADLGSKNGVQLDGHEVSEAQLCHGTWISFGGVLAIFEVLSEQRLTAERQFADSRRQTTLDLTRRLDPTEALDALLAQVLASALELADAERAFVIIIDGHGELEVRARRARNGALLSDARFCGSTEAVRRTLARSCATVLCDARADALLGNRPSIAAEQIRALLCLPLLIGERASGVLYLDSSSPGKIFTALDLELLEAFVAQATLVLGIASVHEELVALALKAGSPG